MVGTFYHYRKYLNPPMFYLYKCQIKQKLEYYTAICGLELLKHHFTLLIIFLKNRTF